MKIVVGKISILLSVQTIIEGPLTESQSSNIAIKQEPFRGESFKFKSHLFSFAEHELDRVEVDFKEVKFSVRRHLCALRNLQRVVHSSGAEFELKIN